MRRFARCFPIFCVLALADGACAAFLALCLVNAGRGYAIHWWSLIVGGHEYARVIIASPESEITLGSYAMHMPTPVEFASNLSLVALTLLSVFAVVGSAWLLVWVYRKGAQETAK